MAFAVSDAKGQLELELAPDGQSFVGAGHLSDGTPITWTGTRVQAGAAQ